MSGPEKRGGRAAGAGASPKGGGTPGGGPLRETTVARHTRREFLRRLAGGTVTVAAGLAGLGLLGRSITRSPMPHRLANEPPVLRPPGALAERDFLAACIRCTRCRDVCPSEAIKLAGPGDPAQRDTPFILPVEAPCTLCLDCTKVCPSGALQPVAVMTGVKMGLAVVDERTCVSHNGSGVCGACHTACPLKNKAITQGLHNAPKIHAEECVGCGLCEEACIVEGIKAIRVFSGREVA